VLLHCLLPDNNHAAIPWTASSTGAQHFIRLLHTDRSAILAAQRMVIGTTDI
jgi:hypothetical protein